ncbi:MAG: phytanoyl-CoA dioxygenase family protein [Thalassobaculum sp.]|uniref:phytanoyl-CoA dioxygenase family protein n=1 Tax=Thalassobaculum sp. TaxID=2022740 RepID=UPI0032EE1472
MPGVPAIEASWFDDDAGREAADPEIARIARDLGENGFAVLDFPDPEIETLAEEIKASLLPRFDFERWRRELWPKADGLRLQDAWSEVEAVRRIACNARILEILEALYGRKPFPFQTLNFPVGTQQHFHSDAVFFSSVPERFMCGVWVALEDIDDDNGPLLYYPGSHKLPIVTNDMMGWLADEEDNAEIQTHLTRVWQAEVRAGGFREQRFHARKGQALIWLSNLLHGGSRHLDTERTRWSQVTHYYFEDCAYWTPVESDVFYGRIAFREPVDVLTGRPVGNRYIGRDIAPDFIRSVRPSWMVPAPETPTAPEPAGPSPTGWRQRAAGIPGLRRLVRLARRRAAG